MAFTDKTGGSGRVMTNPTSGGLSYDQHEEDSKIAQRQADKWLITGTAFMGTLVFGFIGLPIFLRGLYLQRKATQDGMSVRPIMVTLIGYLVILDGFLNTVGWALDFIANHSLLNRVFFTSGGGEAVESAWKLAKQYFKLTGKPTKTATIGSRSRRVLTWAKPAASRWRIAQSNPTDSTAKPLKIAPTG